MNTERIIKDMSSFLDDKNMYQNEPMSNHTSFKTGGPADLLVTPTNSIEFQKLLMLFSKTNTSFIVLGKGSNVLVSDNGIRGVVIKIADTFNTIDLSESIIIAQAGATLKRVVTFGLEQGLTGIETLAGIPGTIGGAVAMNAGAYGGEIKNKLKKVELIDENFDIIEMDADELKLSYRTSIFSHSNMYVTKAFFELDHGDVPEAKAILADITAKRKAKQPLNYPSAGSTFKRPVGHYAGTLIDEMGLKGHTVGGASVSELHAGFVINKNGATSRDIYALIRDIQEKIYLIKGIKLEPEVKFLGEFEKQNTHDE